MCRLHDRFDDIISSGCSLNLTDWEQTELRHLEIKRLYIQLEVMISYNNIIIIFLQLCNKSWTVQCLHDLALTV